MTTLDKIRAEIENDTNRYQFQGYGIDTYLKIDDVLAVIDKYAEQEPCEDAVDRADTLAEFKRLYFDNDTVIRCAELILGKMPSVQPICEEKEKGECPWYAG